MNDPVAIAISVALALLSLGFGVWAGVVAWNAKQIISTLKELGGYMGDIAKEFHGYANTTERRISAIEEWKNIEQRRK